MKEFYYFIFEWGFASIVFINTKVLVLIFNINYHLLVVVVADDITIDRLDFYRTTSEFNN